MSIYHLLKVELEIRPKYTLKLINIKNRKVYKFVHLRLLIDKFYKGQKKGNML